MKILLHLKALLIGILVLFWPMLKLNYLKRAINRSLCYNCPYEDTKRNYRLSLCRTPCGPSVPGKADKKRVDNI